MNEELPRVPTKAGLRFCRDCVHQKCVGHSILGQPKCTHPVSYHGGDFDLVTGHDGRKFHDCFSMRLDVAGRCGRDAKLFERSDLVSILRSVA